MSLDHSELQISSGTVLFFLLNQQGREMYAVQYHFGV